jgi:hypothetical protein
MKPLRASAKYHNWSEVQAAMRARDAGLGDEEEEV